MNGVGFTRSTYIPLLFVHIETNRKGDTIIEKIVDELFIPGHPTKNNPVIEKTRNRFTLRTISTGQRFLCIYALKIVEYEDVSFFIDGDDKLLSCDLFPISRSRHRVLQSAENNFKRAFFSQLLKLWTWYYTPCLLF